MIMSAFEPSSIKLTGRLKARGRCDDVFPLFSPLGEKKWVPGWDPVLLHPRGEDWARGLIFTTQEELGEAVWVVAQLDRESCYVEYYRVEPGRYVARVRVQCGDDGVETDVSVEYEFVGLSARGNADIAAMRPEDYQDKMRRWESWINSHLATSR